MTNTGETSDPRLFAALRLVVGLNLAYFCVEIVVALTIGSVALIADSVDFLEDMALNSLVLAALRLSPLWRARLGMGLAGLLIYPLAPAL